MSQLPTTTTNRISRPQKVSEGAGSYFNCIIYGGPGCGKTTLAATGPTPTLFLDCDQGLLALRNPEPALVQELGLKLDELYFVSIKTYDDILAEIEKIRQQTAQQPGCWGTVVLDNLTELQRVLINDILVKQRKPIPTQQDWGIILLQVQHIVRTLRNLPVNTVFIAHERRDDTGIRPALSGQIETELPGYVDLMARYTLVEKDQGEGKPPRLIRKLRCRPQLGAVPVKAKSRSSRLSDWEEPNLSVLIEKTRND